MANPKKVPGVQYAQASPIEGDAVDVMGAPRSMDVPTDAVDLNVEPPVESNGIPTSLVEALKTPQDRLQEMINSPEKRALLQKLQGKSEEAVHQQAQGLQQNEADLKNFEAQGTPINLAPAASLVDAWTGSKFAQNYQQPMSQDERAQKIMAMKNALQQQRQGLTGEQLNLLKAQLAGPDMKNLMGLARLDQRGNTIGQRADQIAAQAVKSIEQHPAMSQMNKQSIAIDRGIHTIDQKGILTPETFAEIERDYGNAISGGGVFGEFALQRIEAPGVGRTLARLKEKYGNRPIDLRQESPKVVEQLREQLMRLRDSYGGAQAQLFDRLSSGLTYANTPEAQKALEQRRAFYEQNAKRAAIPIENPNPIASKKKAAPQAPSGPTPGMVEDGHRFIGGDPSDPKNWEEVK